MDDPIYVAPGEEFDDEEDSWRYIHDIEQQAIIKKVFAVCGGRKYFATPKEARKWRKIDGQITRGVLPLDWIDHCIAWAKKKNYRVTRIKVDALGSYVMNKAKMQDFLTSKKPDLKPKQEEEGAWRFDDKTDL